MIGVILSPFYIIYALFMMLVVLVDRIGVTIANNLFGKHWLYFINKKAQGSVYRDNMSSLTDSAIQISDAKRKDVKNAQKIAIHARRIFDDCNPTFYGDHWHYKEVKVDVLATRVSAQRKAKLKWLTGEETGEVDMIPFLTDEELKVLETRFIWASRTLETISFSKFCLFIGEALHGTRKFLEEEKDVGSSITQMYEH